MEEKTIDARGLACPKPVLLTRDALQAGDATRLRVLVDNMASCENVTRMIHSLGHLARIDKRGEDEIQLVIDVASAAEEDPMPVACRPASRNMVLVSSDRFGEGDDELGRVLMRAFVKTLKEVVPIPEATFFINAGVRLTTEGSPLIQDIRELEEGGMGIFSCGTCLDFFDLKEKLAVGKVTNMFEVVSYLSSADRVLRP